MLRVKIKLKEVMKEKKVTQTMLSEMIGIRQATISAYYSNKNREVNLSIIEKIAEALNIDDISALLQFEKKEKLEEVSK